MATHSRSLGEVAGPARAAETGSFVLLQRLACSFGELRKGHPTSVRRERSLIRIAQTLGATAVPLCTRELGSRNEDRARWAYLLLGQLAEDAGVRDRVVRAMRELAASPSTTDPGKLRALAMLSELDADVPPTQFQDLGEVHQRSVRQLAACLTSPADVAQAADMLVVSLDDDELAGFLDELVAAEPARGELLIEELLLRDDVSDPLRRELRQLRAAVRVERAAPGVRHEHESRCKTQLNIGLRGDGRSVIVASQRQPATRPVRWRVMCCSISSDGALMDALYEDDYTPGQLRRRIIEPLEREGFRFGDVDRPHAARVVAAAARATRDAGELLPRGFYLGRDMLRLYHEHQRTRERDADDRAALLARGLELIQRHDHARARPLLERYVATAPDDPAGRAALGVCCLGTGELVLADTHLQRAAWLEPTNPLHHWNLASVAHRRGRLGGCYASFTIYLDLRDDGAGARERSELARSFVDEYERLARLEYPGTPPRILARAEEQLADARDLVQRDQVKAGIAELRKAVRLLPDHHPSWSYLAVLYSELDQLAQAKRCAQRALELAPAHEETEALLGLIEHKLTRRGRLAKRPT